MKTKKEMLQLATIRYAMSFNSYQKYIPTVIASDVSEKTVSTILENSVDLLGVNISENSVRKYNNSVYLYACSKIGVLYDYYMPKREG